VSRVVLLHGFTQSARSWAPLRPALERAGHEVIAVDLPGHGSAAAQRASLEEAAAGIAGECGRASYVGYSLGGRVALHVALAYPQHVERLVLISTTAGIDDPTERAARREADEALADELERGGDPFVPAFVERWLAGPLFAGLAPDQRGVDARVSNTAAGLASSLRLAGAGTQRPRWDELDRLTMPVLVMAGTLDPKFRVLAERLVQLIGSSATLTLVPGGHALPFEQPADVAGRIIDFLT